MSDSTPSPFRRFPWLQLAFCIACLTATAWTWTRYSGCWRMGPSDPQTAFSDVVYGSGRVWSDRFVEATGRVASPEYFPVGSMDEDEWDPLRRPSLPFWLCLLDLGEPGDKRGRVGVIVLEEVNVGSKLTLRGRLRDSFGGTNVLWIDATASRFHGASIAGLVVGAMGCFIFGLYLRRWLRKRKAAADGLHH